MPGIPFEKDEEELVSKKGLKKVSSQKSIFDNQPKKPTQADLDKQVNTMHKQSMQYKQQMSELAVSFRQVLDDKTIVENKNPFVLDKEREILTNLLSLAQEINNDPNENEGMGSLGLITLLIKACLKQRDKLNKLEYNYFQLVKKLNSEKEKKSSELDTSNKSE